MEKLGKALVNFARAFGEFVAVFTKECNKMKECLKNNIAIMKYPNGRVKHLALYGRKARTRKKNLKRILKG